MSIDRARIAEVMEHVRWCAQNTKSAERIWISLQVGAVDALFADHARLTEEVERLRSKTAEEQIVTLTARAEAAEAREQEAARALEKANTPDMFWDAEDPEGGYVDEYEVLDRYSPGEIVRIQCAKSLPDMYGVYVTDVEREGDWKYTFGTLEECEAAIADASVVKGPKS